MVHVFFSDPFKVMLTFTSFAFYWFIMYLVANQKKFDAKNVLLGVLLVLIIPFSFSCYSFFIGRYFVYTDKTVNVVSYRHLTNKDDYEFTLKDGTKIVLDDNSVRHYDAYSRKKRPQKVKLEAYFPKNAYKSKVKAYGSNAKITTFYDDMTKVKNVEED